MKRYKVTDECIDDFLCMYCEGKGILWNMFFGWRNAEWNKNGVWVSAEYIIPERIFKMAQEFAERYN